MALSKEITEYVNEFKSGIDLYDLAEKFLHVPESEYTEGLKNAVNRKGIKISGFKAYPKGVRIREVEG